MTVSISSALGQRPARTARRTPRPWPCASGSRRPRWRWRRRRRAAWAQSTRPHRHQDSRVHLDPGPLVVVLVLAAAVLHASWNAIAHAAEDRLVGFALISTSTLVLGTVLVLVGEPVGWHYFWLAALSAALHVAYLLLLMAELPGRRPQPRLPALPRHRRRARRRRLGRAAALAAGPRRRASAPAWSSLGLLGVTLRRAAADQRGRRARHRHRARHRRRDRRLHDRRRTRRLRRRAGRRVRRLADVLQSWVGPAVRRRQARPRASSPISRRQVADGPGRGSRSRWWRTGWSCSPRPAAQLAAVAALRELEHRVRRALGAFVLHEALGPQAAAAGAGADRRRGGPRAEHLTLDRNENTF